MSAPTYTCYVRSRFRNDSRCGAPAKGPAQSLEDKSLFAPSSSGSRRGQSKNIGKINLGDQQLVWGSFKCHYMGKVEWRSS
jgi:hypothetical protein